MSVQTESFIKPRLPMWMRGRLVGNIALSVAVSLALTVVLNSLFSGPRY